MMRLEHDPEALPGLALMRLAFRPPLEAEDAGRYLAALEQVGAQDTPFLLMLDLAGAGVPPQAVRRQQASWIRQNRARLRRNLRAVAVVMRHPTPRARQSFERLFGVPVLVTDQSADARPFLLAAGGAAEAQPS